MNQLNNRCKLVHLIHDHVMQNYSFSDSLVLSETVNSTTAYNIWRLTSSHGSVTGPAQTENNSNPAKNTPVEPTVSDQSRPIKNSRNQATSTVLGPTPHLPLIPKQQQKPTFQTPLPQQPQKTAGTRIE